MEDKVSNYHYNTASGRITGRSHLQSSTPCQDYVSIINRKNIACIALADGAGSRSKSNFGAETAVKATIRFISKNFDELWLRSQSSPKETSDLLLNYCLASLKRKAKRLNCEIEDLASTLLFVAHSEGRYLAGHLGDGYIAKSVADSKVVSLSHPDNGEFANTTVFITDKNADVRIRLFSGEDNRPMNFAIMSDGTAESLYLRSQKAPAAAIGKLFEWNSKLSSMKMRYVLKRNLEQSFSKKSSDDCSIALLNIQLLDCVP
ncbi:hypothetical protein BV923_20400 [Pectobacterium odoriferum]|uniref:PP2C family serine/threonine-protein phosphatase n=1 Tax=Pectobacterium odoriferum TaxID=78398 RepID=UPI000CD187B5|nr:PP2C family serine/threonine-protein phosphatase [Pectobacterium odoriferum]POE19107.1 hypothetical protein BV923_20400 [Pectobacterium odoriferum]